MQIITEPAKLRYPSGRRGLVPTLGALHAGHASLMHFIRPHCDEVVVSIFVNPTQFRPGEDFERYPRTPEQDLALCEQAGVDVVLMPNVEAMYPAGQDALYIRVSSIGDHWEGSDRPGHFDGVATVVARLFILSEANTAVFSYKDLQQCAIIRQLVKGLGMKVELLFAPTLREPDGLAMSSRNVYLSPAERSVAPQLYRCLQVIKDRINQGKSTDIEGLLLEAKTTLDPLFSLSYLALVNRETMQETTPNDPIASVIIAAKLGKTRLIDNLAVYD